MNRKIISILMLFLFLTSVACNNHEEQKEDKTENQDSTMQAKVNQFALVKLTTDISDLSENQKEMLKILYQVSEIMNEIYWIQAYGNKDELLASLKTQAEKDFVMINYGPWERLNDNKPFLSNFGEKPAGANFYPTDMTNEEFEALTDSSKTSLYTIIKRDTEGKLVVVPYYEAFKEQVTKASELLAKASELAEDKDFKNYLSLRSKALLTDDYFASDMAWMDMKTNRIDFVVGPIENYEDALYGYKAAHEAFILIKDMDWSKKLEKFSALLPALQKQLPVEDKYKTEKPGSNSDLNAYDVLYYGGDCNAGSKTIAINLPNDEKVQLAKGSRRLQLKNAMQAKYDKILVPISNLIIDPSQRKHVTFDAFFSNTMFHEVAHGLGIKNTLANPNISVRDAIKEQYSALEEGKADILGLFLVTKLKEMGEIETDLMDNYTTFLAGIFRSVRFGAASAHGKANLVRYNYFKEKEAFSINEDGTYKVNFEKMQAAMNSLSELILKIQGDGDYNAAKALITEKAIIDASLQKALDKIAAAGIYLDVIYEQGPATVGL